MATLADYDRALDGESWTGWDGQRVRGVPARMKRRLWSSGSVIHIARPEGLVMWHGDEATVRPIYYCGASGSRPLAVDLDGGRRLCAACLKQVPARDADGVAELTQSSHAPVGELKDNEPDRA